MHPALHAQDLWAKRERPTPLDLDALLALENGHSRCAAVSGGVVANGGDGAHSNGGAAEELGASACKALGLTDAHRVWSTRENAQVWCSYRAEAANILDIACTATDPMYCKPCWQVCIVTCALACLGGRGSRAPLEAACRRGLLFTLADTLHFPQVRQNSHCRACAQVFLEGVRQFLVGRPGEVGAAVFDKEDDLAVEFVTAASNLRAAAYGIPQQTLFTTKVLRHCLCHCLAGLWMGSQGWVSGVCHGNKHTF